MMHAQAGLNVRRARLDTILTNTSHEGGAREQRRRVIAKFRREPLDAHE